VLPDPPEEVAVAMSDIAGAAPERLLAISVAARLAAMQTMFEAEPTEACGPKRKHNPDRVAVHHGTEVGSYPLAGNVCWWTGVASMISIARTTNRNVTRWRDGQMALRWTAAGMLNAEQSFRRIKGHKQLPQLIDALR
jgi:hypothetical protein